MTPLGHAATAVILAAGCRRMPLRALLIGALLPDVDFLAGFVGRLDELHRGATHSLAFAAAAAMVAMLPNGPRLARAAAVFVGVVSHLLVDSVLDTNPNNGIGVPFLWPVVTTPFAPFSLLDANCPGWNQWQSAIACGWKEMLIETPIWLIAAALLCRRGCLYHTFFDRRR